MSRWRNWQTRRTKDSVYVGSNPTRDIHIRVAQRQRHLPQEQDSMSSNLFTDIYWSVASTIVEITIIIPHSLNFINRSVAKFG